MNTPQTFIFVGRSGSGKGTQIELLKKHMAQVSPSLGEYHFVMGDSLRAFMKDEGYAQETIRSIVNKGELVPDLISSSMFVVELLHNLKQNDNLYIDGIPRSASQAEVIISILKFYNRSNVHIVNIEVTPEEVEKRMMLRGRADDTKESIASRLKFYEDTVVPAITYLKEKSGFSYLELEGNRSVEDIQKDLISYVLKLV